MTTQAQALNKKASTSNKASGGGLIFPQDLFSEGHGSYVTFTAINSSGSDYKGNGDFSRNSQSNGQTVSLFMPPQVQARYVANWGTVDLGIIGAAMDAYDGGFNYDDVEQYWNVVKNTVVESSTRTILSAIQSITPLATADAYAHASKTIANPYTEVIFNGVENRTFSFTFLMYPRNASEQGSIRDIVKFFKVNRTPDVKFQGQSNYWTFPSEFAIKFYNSQGENPWIFKIANCALTNFTVDHAPDGHYAVMSDDSPRGTSVTLEFTEMEALTKAKVEQGY